MPENERLPPPVNLKHRLIGAVALVSAAVILVPLILSEREPPAELKTVSDVPDRGAAPVASEYTLPEPPSDDSRDGGGTISGKKKVEPRRATARMPEVGQRREQLPEQRPRATSGPAAEVAKASKGWVVQVGIFANAGNATRLSERLKQQGHDVLLDSISQNNEKRTRLRVGPFADKDAAQRAQAKIQQQAGVAGAVVTYP